MILPLLLVAMSLQTEMTPQEKKKTGVYKLNQKEKGALQAWLDNHYVAKGKSTPDQPPAVKSQLEENLHDGQYIRLKDGSTWRINPDDTPITQAWITPVDIAVSTSDDPEYPYTLTNTLTKSAVRAQKVSSVPSSNPIRTIVPPTQTTPPAVRK